MLVDAVFGTLSGRREPAGYSGGVGSGQFGPGDVGHRCLDDGELDLEQGLDPVGHVLIVCYCVIAIGSAPLRAGKLPRGGVSERPKEHASKACDG